jgi:AraC-like DNA-binding protein
MHGVVVIVGGWGLRARVERLATHSHPEALLAWSDSATVTISNDSRDWVLPPGHAMWIPPDVPHAIAVVRSGTGRALTFDPRRCPVGWREPTALVVTPLVRELVRHLAGPEGPGTQARRRAEAALFDLLEPAPATEIRVPMPADDRLRVIAEGLLADPADGRDLARWAYDVGAGVRTVSRLFTAETGMTFSRWRTHARIRAAVTLLADGLPVGTVARRVGFTKPAAFAEAFRRVTGRPPSDFLPR